MVECAEEDYDAGIDSGLSSVAEKASRHASKRKLRKCLLTSMHSCTHNTTNDNNNYECRLRTTDFVILSKNVGVSRGDLLSFMNVHIKYGPMSSLQRNMISNLLLAVMRHYIS